MYSSSDPISMMLAIGFFVLLIAFCSLSNSNDTPKKRYSNYDNKAYEFEENLDWDDSWDDKFLHQGKYADNDETLGNPDYDPSWDEDFRK